MATLMKMRMPGVTASDYDRVMEALGLESEPEERILFHCAFESDGAWVVIDLWESEEAFKDFEQRRLMPALAEAGLLDRFRDSPPAQHFHEAHNYVIPAEMRAMAMA